MGDQKGFLSVRPMKCELHYLSKADGSAILAQGKTVTIFSCYGPVEMMKVSKQKHNSAQFDTVFQSKQMMSPLTEKSYETIVQKCLEKCIYLKNYSRCEIVSVVQEMQNHGSLLSCAINAGVLALLSSGIEMKFVVGAVTCALNHDGQIIVDPDLKQSENAKALITVAHNNLSKHPVTVDVTGLCKPNDLMRVIPICYEVAKNEIFPFYKSVIKKYMT